MRLKLPSFLSMAGVVKQGFNGVNTPDMPAAQAKDSQEPTAPLDYAKPEPMVILAGCRSDKDPEYVAGMTP